MKLLTLSFSYSPFLLHTGSSLTHLVLFLASEIYFILLHCFCIGIKMLQILMTLSATKDTACKRGYEVVGNCLGSWPPCRQLRTLLVMREKVQ